VAASRCVSSTPMTRRCCSRRCALFLNGIEDVIGRVTQRSAFLSGNWDKSCLRRPLLTDYQRRWRTPDGLAGVPYVWRSSDQHHLTFTQPRTLGRRVSDGFIVPGCRAHHREHDRSGDEAAWWGKLNIDPLPVALRLWQRWGDASRPTGGSAFLSAYTSIPDKKIGVHSAQSFPKRCLRAPA
jgi:hypothetical protein